MTSTKLAKCFSSFGKLRYSLRCPELDPWLKLKHLVKGFPQPLLVNSLSQQYRICVLIPRTASGYSAARSYSEKMDLL